MEPPLEICLETMNLTGQQQPLSTPTETGDSDLDKILADCGIDEYLAMPGSFDPNSIDSFDINELINTSNEQTDSIALIETQLSEASISNDDMTALLHIMEKQEPLEYEQPSQSTFVEFYEDTNVLRSQQTYISPSSVPEGRSPVESKDNSISTLIYAQNYVSKQEELIQSASKSKRHKVRQQRTTTVGPVDYVIHSGACQPCATAQMQDDYGYQQSVLQYDASETKKIQILCQPRSKFRPRTQNESKSSSHYVRCDEGVKPEYPTINIPQAWFFQSDVNLIEVALMGVDKQPHPYAIDNKNSSNTYEDNALVFKQGVQNVLYFRLTNEDFQNGYKTFMIELIKSKQDDVITKDLIRTRQLEHSMLRFTRIFQLGKGNFQRDDGSEEYSTVMSEAYGDVEIEHMGPQYGPMSGNEMVYVVLKGRILKNELKIEVTEEMTSWHHNVENFTKNGNVVYFSMPAFPFPQFVTITAKIIIYYRGEELTDKSYLYKGSLDQELADLRISDQQSSAASSSASNSFNAFDLFSSTGVCPSSSSRRTSTTKSTKRLNHKLNEKK